jgi:hypothetical protein
LRRANFFAILPVLFVTQSNDVSHQAANPNFRWRLSIVRSTITIWSMTMIRLLFPTVLLAIVAGCGGDRRSVPVQEPETNSYRVEEGFRSLTLVDFEPFFAKPPKADAPPTWRTIGDAIACSGKPKGYLVSKESFGNFTLRLEMRFVASPEQLKAGDFNPNSGVLLLIQPPDKQWPKSLEVQGRYSELGTIKPNGGAADVELNDVATARESARKPATEWNELEIEMQAGGLTVRLNGSVVCTSQPGELTSGKIGLQSEDFEVHFRRLRIR